MRATTTVALLATIVGPLQLAYALPAPTGNASQSAGGPSGSSAATKLPSDVPWALATSVLPARIKVLAGAADEAEAWRLFDGRSGTGLSTDGRPARIRLELSRPTYLDAVAIYGRAPGALSVEAETPAGNTPLMEKASLERGGAGWNRRDFQNGPLTSAVVVTFEPAAPNATMPEIELWGRPASAPPSSATALFPDALFAGVPAGARELRAVQGEQTISPATVSPAAGGGTFTVDADVDPAGIDRAFLVYQLAGQPHFTAAARSINGAPVLGRFGISRGAKGGLQVEEIPPAALVRGTNRIRFFPAEERNPESYRVSNVRVVVVPRAETRMTDASARDMGALRDGREATGWRAEASKPADVRRWEFTSPTQPWGLDFRLPARGVGTLTVAAARGGDKGQIVVDLKGLAPGWHRVPLAKLPATDALTLTLAAGKEESASLSELAIEGSPLPADAAPRLAISYPLSGECVNHRVHVRGFATPAGAEAVYAGGRRMDGAVGRDGAFAFELAEKDAAGREIVVDATYPDGGRARRVVSIGRCVERPPIVAVPGGRPRQPAEDLGAPYGVTVRAGEAASLSFAGLKLDVPAGAVEKDVRLTVRPLPTKDVAPLDPGMTNVSPEAQAFRLGPHGMVFKKPVRVTLPYSKKLIPSGYSGSDVRTFYYDEDLHRWEQVGLLAQNEGELVAVTEHFTDFINATVPMPEHPGTQSLNPTSLKDMKLGDPAAGITLIAPPSANPTGTANLHFPIETPPGRHGIQPDLAITYNSESRNGWLGVGWDLRTSTIQIDTRFGVPKYTGSETYLLDGQMLTRVPPPPGAPSGGQYFARRVEGAFEWIQRFGTGPTDFTWVVTDKNGTKRFYGETQASRLSDPTATSGNIFRWALARVTDVFGNQMTLNYTKVAGSNGEPYVQIYPANINYTAQVGSLVSAPYHVEFSLGGPTGSACDRADQIVDGRPGFQELTTCLLKQIDVKFGTQIIRQYKLVYEAPRPRNLQKSLLSAIEVRGLDGQAAFYRHDFDYFQTPVEQSPGVLDKLGVFQAPVAWATVPKADGTPRTADGLSRNFEQSESNDGHFGVGVNKALSIGVGHTDTSSRGAVFWNTLDFNGDGLPDGCGGDGLLDVAGLTNGGNRSDVGLFSGQLFPSQTTNFGGGQATGGAVSSLVPLSNVNRNIINFRAGVTGIVVAQGNFDFINSARETRTLADMNGDGFVDQVFTSESGVQVRLNDGHNVLQQPPVPWSNYSVSKTVCTPQKLLGPFERVAGDTIGRVTAPFGGDADLGGFIVGKVESVTGVDIPSPGDVAVTIYHAITGLFSPPDDGSAPPDDMQVVWTKVIHSSDPPCAPGPGNSCSGGLTLPVQAGDRIYFRLSSVNGTGGLISWDPQVNYRSLGATTLTPTQLSLREPEGSFIYRFSQSSDYRTVGRAFVPWFADSNGIVSIGGRVVKNTTSDDVTIRIVHEHADGTPPTVRLSETLAANTDVTLPADLGGIAVQANDKLSFEVLSDLPIDPARVRWQPVVSYQNYCRLNPDTGALVCGNVHCTTSPLTCTLEGDPQPSSPLPASIFKRSAVVFYPLFRFQPGTPTTSFQPTSSGPAAITGSVTKSAPTPGPVVVAIQGVNRLYRKHVFQPNEVGTFPMSVTTAPVAAGGQLFFTVYSDTDVSGSISWSPSVEGAVRPLNVKVRADGFAADPSGHGVGDTVMGGGYHGWSYGDWNGAKPLTESQIAFDPASPIHDFFPALITAPPVPPNDSGGTVELDLNPLHALEDVAHYATRAVAGIDAIPGIGSAAEVLQTAWGAGQALVGTFTNIFDDLFCDTEHPVRVTESGNLGFDAGTRVASAGFNTGSADSTAELMDMNGDRYPDSVSVDGIRLNTGAGFEPALGIKLPWGEPRHIEHRSVHFGVGDTHNMVTLTDAKGNAVGFFGASVGLSYGVSVTGRDLIDINGDGLPDHVASDGVGNVRVRLNFGNRFGDEIRWTGTAWSNTQVANHQELINRFGNDLKADSLRLSDTSANNSSQGGGGGGSSWNAGLTGAKSNTLVRELVDMVDVNGDGLPDQIMRKPGLQCGGATDPSDDCIRVKLNLGSKFDAERQIPIKSWPAGASTGLPGGLSQVGLSSPDALSYTFGQGSSGRAGGSGQAWVFTFGGGFSWGSSDNSTMQSFEDIDGDGTVDQVRKANGNAIAYARLNTTGKTNLLKHVTRPLGGGIDLDYNREGNQVEPTIAIDNPKNQWVLSRASVDDGRAGRYTNVFDYTSLGPGASPRRASGHYARDEREDYGYGHVTTIRGVYQVSTGTYLEGDGSRLEQFFENQDFYRKGLLRGEFEEDHTGKIFQARIFKYRDPRAADAAPAVRTGTFFPAETDRYTLFYEGASSNAVAEMASFGANAVTSTHEQRFFNANGDLTELFDFGDRQIVEDDLHVVVVSTNEPNTHITRATSVEALANRTGTTLRKRTAVYKPLLGTLMTLTNILSGGKVPGSGNPGTTYNQASANYGFTYDAFGNVETVTDPTGYKLKYTYDTTTKTYRTQVDDLSFGFTSTTSYDLRFGAVQLSTDVNGQKESFTYDSFGRLCTVKGPDDQSATEPTIAMSYSVNRTSCPNPPPSGAAFPAYAVTRHKDVQHPGDPIDTVTFIDGMGRVIQTRKDAEFDLHADGRVIFSGMNISGQVLFDVRGRVSAQGQPEFGNSVSPTQFFALSMNNPTVYGYDEFGRQTSVNVADGTIDGIQTSTTYSIATNRLGDGRTWFLTSVTDPRGNLREMYSSARGNQAAVREFNQVGPATALTPLTTTYIYDALDQLLTVTDAKGNSTGVIYDTVGQMVSLASPDAGRTEFRFDLNGNLKEKQTPVLQGAGQTIKFVYDFNRLKQIDYPASSDVVYTYGGPTEGGNGAGNRAGRIKKVTFDNGNEERFYDSMGNVREARTTLNRMSTTTGLPPSMTFSMKYTFDWLGRMQTMTFPNWINNNFTFVSGEGEKVTYSYDHGGNIDRITGHHQTTNPQQTSHPIDFVYLDHMGYDQFGARRVLISGNGIANKYGYDVAQRLSAVAASARGTQEAQQNRPPTPFHALRYEYDKNGNITRMKNEVSVQPWRSAPVFVGPLDVTYTYDALNQLRSMTSKYRPNVAYGYQSADTLTYDEIGNIKTKAQTQDRLVWDNQTVNPLDLEPVETQLPGSRFDHNVSGLSYSLDYRYTGTRPHAASSIIETPAGSPASTKTFSYDGNGNNTGNTAVGGNNRVQVWDEENRLKEVKRNGGSLAQFRYDGGGERTKKLTAAGDTWYVNQYFALMPNNRPTKHIFAGETRIATKTDAIFMQTPVLHYYHPDHLGTTSYISDRDQNLVQHERYFAFGELWRPGGEQEETQPDGNRREWLFTGKEWDVDTGLYYFGARYFDPHTSVWQSTDPMLASYIKRGPAGASPKNLGLYTYGWNNPVVMRDPDGRETFASSTQQDIRRFQAESATAKGMNPAAGAPHGFGVSEQFARRNAHLFQGLGAFEATIRNRLGADPTRQIFMEGFGSQFSVAQARAYQLFGELGLSLAMLPVEGPGLLAPGIGGRVSTPFGVAIQEGTPAARAALAEARAGATLFRQGRFGVQETTGAQFWSLSNPAATPGFAARMGMPGGAAPADWIMGGTLRPGAAAISRSAPGIGANPGGALEIVTQPGGVGGLWFHMP